jgi:hypothetical protein
MEEIKESSQEDDQPIDAGTARLLTTFSALTSRRGVLAAGGRILLRIAGVSLLPLLPVDRVFASAIPNCDDDWEYCGIYGAFCKACCGHTGYEIDVCPPCLYKASSWTVCCCNACGSKQGRYVSYSDCCGLKPGYTTAQAQACSGTFCTRGCQQPYWCGSYPSATYRCTIITVGATCSGCQYRCGH